MNRKGINWLEVARRAKVQSTLITDAAAEGIKRGYYKKFHDNKVNLTAYRHFDASRSFDEAEVGSVVEWLSGQEKKRPGFLIHFARKLARVYLNFATWAHNTVYTDPKKFSNSELARSFWNFYVRSFWLVNDYDYIFVNRFLPDEITEAVAKKVPDLHRQTQYLSVLFATDEVTQIKADKLSIHRIASRVLKGEGIDSTSINSAIEVHWKKFKHLNRYYYLQLDYSIADIKRRVRLTLKKLQRRKKESEMNVAQESRRILASLAFPPRLVKKVYAIKSFGYLSNVFDETITFAISQYDPLFLEIARRLGLTRTELVMARGEEIVDALVHGLRKDLKKQLHLRSQDYALVLERGEIEIFTGTQLALYRKQELKSENISNRLRVLKGQAASPGKVRGRVKVLWDLEEINKVKKGDILVAPSTYPALVPAMEKSAAIVTNEGGLLSHAAIVSREIGIPCVVGTKIATKVLKDGDLVEVDANKGVVRKL